MIRFSLDVVSEHALGQSPLTCLLFEPRARHSTDSTAFEISFKTSIDDMTRERRQRWRRKLGPLIPTDPGTLPLSTPPPRLHFSCASTNINSRDNYTITLLRSI